MAKDGTNRGGARPGAGRPKKRDDGKYEHVELTAEQIHELLDSPHISYVSRKSVSYTKAFKEHFWQRYCDGVDPKQIFEDAGLNTAILTRSRINGLLKTLRHQKEKGLSFTEGSEPQVDQPEKTYDFPKPPRRSNKSKLPVLSEADIAQMYNQVAYMSQEIEFLKKLSWRDRRKSSHVYERSTFSKI